MISLLEMISGWLMVVLFAVSVLYPICVLLQTLLSAYLKSASDGRIKEVKVLPWFSKKFMCDHWGNLDLVYFLYVTTYLVVECAFLAKTAIVTHNSLENDFFLEWSTLMFNFWYSVGEFLAIPLLLAGILYGFHKLLRLVFKLQLVASNALQAVKDHENNMHKGE